MLSVKLWYLGKFLGRFHLSFTKIYNQWKSLVHIFGCCPSIWTRVANMKFIEVYVIFIYFSVYIIKTHDTTEITRDFNFISHSHRKLRTIIEIQCVPSFACFGFILQPMSRYNLEGIISNDFFFTSLFYCSRYKILTHRWFL